MDLGVSKVVRSLPGRGIQLNSGALLAERETILFLHADNWLAPTCHSQIQSAIEQGHSFCCFRQRIDAQSWVYRIIEKGNDFIVSNESKKMC